MWWDLTIDFDWYMWEYYKVNLITYSIDWIILFCYYYCVRVCQRDTCYPPIFQVFHQPQLRFWGILWYPRLVNDCAAPTVHLLTMARHCDIMSISDKNLVSIKLLQDLLRSVSSPTWDCTLIITVIAHNVNFTFFVDHQTMSCTCCHLSDRLIWEKSMR